MPQSLSSWCKENNLAKGTVHGKAKDLGIDTSNGLSDDAIEKLSAEFQLVAVEMHTATSTEILTGNHRVTGELAPLPTSVDLGHLRQGASLTTFNSQALAAVDQALELADQLLEDIEDDTSFQLEQLQKTQQANNKLRRKSDQLKARQQQYAIESRLIGIAQGKEAHELQQTMQDLQNLGG